MKTIALLLSVLALAACSCGPQAAYAPAQYAASPCAAAAAPCAQAVQYAAPAPAYAQVYGPAGAREYAVSALNIPPNMAACLISGIRCAVDALFPVPPPSVNYVPVMGVQYQMVTPRAAAPCAAPQVIQVAPIAQPMASPCR